MVSFVSVRYEIFIFISHLISWFFPSEQWYNREIELQPLRTWETGRRKQLPLRASIKSFYIKVINFEQIEIIYIKFLFFVRSLCSIYLWISYDYTTSCLSVSFDFPSYSLLYWSVHSGKTGSSRFDVHSVLSKFLILNINMVW